MVGENDFGAITTPPKKKMRILVVLFLCLFTFFQINATEQHICESQVKNVVQELLNKEQGRSDYGILVKHMKSAKLLFEQNSQRYYQPASNNKVLTTVAGLLSLGPDYIFTTSVYLKDQTLRLVMQGDPSLTSEQLVQSLNQLHISQMNITQVQIDISSFRNTDPVSDSWNFGDLWYDYGAQPSCSVLDHNYVLFEISPGQRVGDPLKVVQVSDSSGQLSILQHIKIVGIENTRTIDSSEKEMEAPNMIYRPGEDFIRISGQMKANANSIYITRSVMKPDEFVANSIAKIIGAKNATVTKRPTDLSQWKKLDVIRSKPLSHIMNITLQVSDNLYAELILRQIGYQASMNTSDSDILQAGIQQVSKILCNKLRVTESSFFQNDGSGLSRQNLLSPQSLVETLENLYRYDANLFKLYRAMLPVGGVSGTLRNRFLDYKGAVQAKTGTLSGVYALSGFVNNQYSVPEEPIVFSIIVNQSPLASSQVAKIIDQIVIYFHLMDPNC